MSLMTPEMRAYAHDLCIKRDKTEACIDCGKQDQPDMPARKKIQIHHRDRNPQNNPADGTNWERRCPKCNAKHDPHGTHTRPKGRRDLYFKGYSERLSERRKPIVQYAEMAKNIKGERLFREFALKMLEENERIEYNDLIDAGAEYCTQQGCSLTQQTIKRYLDKLSNRINGLLELFELSVPGEGEQLVKETFVRMRPPAKPREEWQFADVCKASEKPPETLGK